MDIVAREAVGHAAAAGVAILGIAHIATAVVAGYRQRRREANDDGRAAQPLPGVSVIRPLKGVEPFSFATLQSTFLLKPAPAEILFCVESRNDPIVPIVERLIGEHPHIPALLLVGRDVISANPKLNNLVKGWQVARCDWIAFVDSNVQMPRDALARLAERVEGDTGMVCSPPIGRAAAGGFAAHLECAFLNTHQARWQSAADATGNGFAQGKVMYFNRRVIEAGGGLAALGAEPAEDAAATRLVHRLGKSVRLVDRFFEQPIARRSLAEVFDRQLRWAQLRRATFPVEFTAECLTGLLAPLSLALLAATLLDAPALPVAGALIAFWYGVELALARRLGWTATVAASLARDVVMPIIWLRAWGRRSFVWHGQSMRAERTGPEAKQAPPTKTADVASGIRS